MKTESGTFLAGYVKLPTTADIDLEDLKQVSLCCTAADLKNPIDGLLIESRVTGFKETQNPILAMEAFCHSMRTGVYPPIRVLRWLEESFDVYMADQENKGRGGASLEKIMGLKKGSGGTPPYKKLLLEDRDEMLMEDMDQLMYLGASREQAAEAVTARLSETDWNKTMDDLEDIGAETIADRHKRARREPINDDTAKAIGLHTAEYLSDFLSRFSQLPPKLKNR